MTNVYKEVFYMFTVYKITISDSVTKLHSFDTFDEAARYRNFCYYSDERNNEDNGEPRTFDRYFILDSIDKEV